MFQYGVVFELTPPASPGGPWTEAAIYAFMGPPSDGGVPIGGLAIGPDGSLYGTTRGGGTYNPGTVSQLTPPASGGGSWTLTVLYSFRGDGDGILPGAGLVVSKQGVLYGTTTQGGAFGLGTVFAIEKVSGVWEEKVLASLTGTLSGPNGLILGPNNILYGQAPGGYIRDRTSRG